MKVTKSQLLKIVAPIILINVILSTVDIFSDLRFIIKLFTGVTTCLKDANYEKCEAITASKFCNTSGYDHSICGYQEEEMCRYNDSINMRENSTLVPCCHNSHGDQYSECVLDPDGFCGYPYRQFYPVTCASGYHPVFGAILLGAYLKSVCHL